MYWFVETCVIQVTLNAIKTFDKSFKTSLGAAVKFLLRAFGIYSSTHAFMWNVLVKIHLQPAVLCFTKINTQIVINLWLNLYLCAVINVLVSILICVCLLLVSFSIPFSPEKPQHQVENIFQCFFTTLSAFYLLVYTFHGFCMCGLMSTSGWYKQVI